MWNKWCEDGLRVENAVSNISQKIGTGIVVFHMDYSINMMTVFWMFLSFLVDVRYMWHWPHTLEARVELSMYTGLLCADGY